MDIEDCPESLKPSTIEGRDQIADECVYDTVLIEQELKTCNEGDTCEY